MQNRDAARAKSHEEQLDVEARRVEQTYARRDASDKAALYSRLDAYADFSWRERERILVKLLRNRLKLRQITEARCVEIGCGSGANLMQLMSLGFLPQNLIGNELLQDRVATARVRLPQAIEIYVGDAREIKISKETQDIVYQSTVFSSILDDEIQDQVAAHMWQWLKPGGAVLWYDFTYDNPRNKDVRGVPVKRLSTLFPGGKAEILRVTLAPPIGRQLGRVAPWMLGPVSKCMPFLRTHIWAWIAKP